LLLRPAALALACLTAFAGGSSASALVGGGTVRHTEKCNAHRPHTLRMTRQVLVWNKPSGTDAESGGRRFTLYACLRPAGQSVAIGQRVGGANEYPGNVATTHLKITGAVVSDLFTIGLTGQGECFKYDPTDPTCPIPRQTARVFDLAARRTLLQPLAGRAVAYAFTPSGAIAWESPTSLLTRGSPLMLQAVGFDPSSLQEGPIETLDTGDLAPPLDFTGLTLEWTNAGQPKSAVLTATS
jgi:hypothetical protein